jgi:hypothetical protein
VSAILKAFGLISDVKVTKSTSRGIDENAKEKANSKPRQMASFKVEFNGAIRSPAFPIQYFNGKADVELHISSLATPDVANVQEPRHAGIALRCELPKSATAPDDSCRWHNTSFELTRNVTLCRYWNVNRLTDAQIQTRRDRACWAMGLVTWLSFP